MARAELVPNFQTEAARLFYEQLSPVDRNHVQLLSRFTYKVCQGGDGHGYVSDPVIVAYGGFCRKMIGMDPRSGRSYETPHDIDVGILLQSNSPGVEPIFTEKLVRYALYKHMSALGIIRIKISPRSESGGPNSYELYYEEGLPIDVTPPMRRRIEPRMESSTPPVHNPPWLFNEWVAFQNSRGWPWTALWKMPSTSQV